MTRHNDFSGKSLYSRSLAALPIAMSGHSLKSILLTFHDQGRCNQLPPYTSVVPKATQKASREPLKGPVKAQKKTRELLGGTTENRVSPMRRGHSFYSRQINEFI